MAVYLSNYNFYISCRSHFSVCMIPCVFTYLETICCFSPSITTMIYTIITHDPRKSVPFRCFLDDPTSSFFSANIISFYIGVCCLHRLHPPSPSSASSASSPPQTSLSPSVSLSPQSQPASHQALRQVLQRAGLRRWVPQATSTANCCTHDSYTC